MDIFLSADIGQTFGEALDLPFGCRGGRRLRDHERIFALSQAYEGGPEYVYRK